MRVVVVTTSFPRDEQDACGHFVAAHARQLAAQGHEIHVIAAGQSRGRGPEERRGPLCVHWAGGAPLFSWPGAAARLRRAPWQAVCFADLTWGVQRKLRALGRPDLVIAHWIVPSAWPLLAGTRHPIEAVAHGADVRLLLRLPPPLRRHILAALLDRGARLRFVAHASLEALRASVGGPLGHRLEAQSEVAPLPFELPPIDELRAQRDRVRRELGVGLHEALVVLAGRLVAAKRADLAVRAAAVPCDRALRLVIVGDGPERRALERLARGLGAPVAFAGQLPRDRALAVVAAADALVHAAVEEAAPTVVREARALGVPVLACPAGDLARWAEDDPLLVLAPSEPAAFAAALAALLRRPT
ncbi:MAG: glycosyltransferase family 4 protein [Deltaproteobacteria bacterium]|nr:glycosyltransferase family 4 protein [Deltaproteobacteria bacterium]